MEKQSPNKFWYVAYIFLWFVPGIICYFVWRGRDEKIARRQLLDSICIGFLIWIGIPSILSMLAFPLGLIFG